MHQHDDTKETCLLLSVKSFAFAKLSHDLFMSPQSGEMVVSVNKNLFGIAAPLCSGKHGVKYDKPNRLHAEKKFFGIS